MNFKNKLGFSLIETMIVVVVLTTGLLLIYSSYNSVFYKAKKKIYHDDISYVYKAGNINNYLVSNSTLPNYIEAYFKSLNENETPFDDILGIKIGSSSTGLFPDEKKDTFENLLNFYNTKQVFVLKPDFKIVAKCKDEIIQGENNGLSNSEFSMCKNSFSSIEYDFLSYIRTLGNNEWESNYLLLFVFRETKDGFECLPSSKGCINNYVWLDSGVSYE